MKRKVTGPHGHRRAKRPSYSGPGEYLTITPEKDPSIVSRHVGRYERAVRLVTDLRGLGGRWLDCACGTGYGSKPIIELGEAEEYWGVDRNEQAIRLARCSYGNRTHTGGRFLKADIRGVTHWLPGLGPFDVILSIETLEHLAPRVQMLWLTVAARNLTENGVMVIACPIGWDAPSKYNRYHVFEPKLGTLAKMLDSVFEEFSLEGLDAYVDTGGKNATQAMVMCTEPRATDTDYG